VIRRAKCSPESTGSNASVIPPRTSRRACSSRSVSSSPGGPSWAATATITITATKRPRRGRPPVTLRCQRTGTTSLPLGGTSKYASTGQRNSHTRPRNLCRFIRAQMWAISDVTLPCKGMLSMDECVTIYALSRSADSAPRRAMHLREAAVRGACSRTSCRCPRTTRMAAPIWTTRTPRT
jgi:hypothetical protein